MVNYIDPDSVKSAHAIPEEVWSCHTVVIDAYVVEGHVPAEAIERILAGQVDVTGIALPGMPQGSPGMSGRKAAPFEIISFTGDDLKTFGDY